MLARETAPPTIAVGGTWLPTDEGGVFFEQHPGTALVSDCRGGMLADEPVRCLPSYEWLIIPSRIGFGKNRHRTRTGAQDAGHAATSAHWGSGGVVWAATGRVF